MDVIGSAVFRFEGDDRPVKNTLGNVERTVQGWAGRLSGFVRDTFVVATGTLIATGLGRATGMVRDFAQNSLVAFGDLQAGMNEVFSLLPGIAQPAMNHMTEQVKSLSKEFGVLPAQVIPALYEALSSGVPPGNVFDFLETAQKAAIGGNTQVMTSVDGLTSVINAYGSEVITAKQASDIMFTTVKLGKTTFDELAGSLYNVNPIAASLGVGFDNVGAALAAMTAQGVPTGVATTQLRQLLVELSDSGSQVSKTFQEVSGQTFKDFIASGHNVQDALLLMEAAAQKNKVGVNDLFSSVEAGNAALALTGRGTQTFTDFLDQMTRSAGATDDAFKTMDRGVNRSLAKLKASFAVLMSDVGERFAPTFQQLTDTVLAHMPQISSIVLRGVDSISSGLQWLAGTAIPWLVNAWQTIQPAAQAAGEAVMFVGQVLGAVAQEAIGYGSNIIGSVAQGMYDAASYVVDALNYVGSIITYWLEPHSPPKLLPNLGRWGADAATIWMNGWADADFSAFAELAGTIESELRSMVDQVAGITATGVIPMIIGSRTAIAEAIEQIRTTGTVTEEVYARIRAAAGPVGDAAEDLVRKYEAQAAAAREYAAAQEELDRVTASYEDRLGDLNTALEETEDAYRSTLDGLKQKMEDTRRAYDDTLNGLRDRLDSVKNSYDATLTGMRDRLESIKGVYAGVLRGLADTVDQTKASFDSALGLLKTNLEQTRSRWKGVLDGLRGELRATQAQFDAQLNPLDAELAQIDAQEQQINQAEELARLQEILASEEATEAEKKKAALQIQRIQLQQQRDAIAAERDAATQAVEERIAQAEEQEQAELDAIETQIKEQERLRDVALAGLEAQIKEQERLRDVAVAGVEQEIKLEERRRDVAVSGLEDQIKATERQRDADMRRSEEAIRATEAERDAAVKGQEEAIAATEAERDAAVAAAEARVEAAEKAKTAADEELAARQALIAMQQENNDLVREQIRLLEEEAKAAAKAAAEHKKKGVAGGAKKGGAGVGGGLDLGGIKAPSAPTPSPPTLPPGAGNTTPTGDTDSGVGGTAADPSGPVARLNTMLDVSRAKVEEWKNTAVAAFNTVVQPVLSVVAAVGGAYLTFQGLSAIAATVGGAITGISGFFGGLSLAVAESGTIIGGLVALLGGPITLAIGAIALAVGAAIFAWTTNFGGFRDFVNTTILPMFGALWDAVLKGIANLQPAWEALMITLGKLQPVAVVIGGFVMGVFVGLLGFLTGALPGAFMMVSGVIQFFLGIVNLIVDVVTGVVRIVAGLLTGNWSAAWTAAKDLVMNTVENIAQIFGGFVQAVIGLVGGFVGGVIGFFQNLYDAIVGHSIIPDLVNDVLAWFNSLVTTAIAWISQFVLDIILFFTNLYDQAMILFNKAKDAIYGIIGQFVDDSLSRLNELYVKGSLLFNYVKEAMITRLREMKDAIPGLIGQLITAVGEKLNDFKNSGRALIDKMWTGISEGFGELLRKAREKLQELRDMLPFSEPRDRTSPLYGLSRSGASIVGQIQKGIDEEQLRIGGLMMEGVNNAGASISSALAAAAGDRITQHYWQLTAQYAYQEERTLRDDIRLLQMLEPLG